MEDSHIVTDTEIRATAFKFITEEYDNGQKLSVDAEVAVFEFVTYLIRELNGNGGQ